MVLAVEAVQWYNVDPEALVDRFARHLVAEGYARITVRVYKNSAHRFFHFLSSRRYPARLESISGSDVDAFINDVHQTRSAATAYSRYWGLRVFFDWQVSEGAIRESPVLHARQPGKPTKRSRGRTQGNHQIISTSIKAA